MKKFIYNLFAFGILLIVIYLSVSYYVKPKVCRGSDYMSAMVDKHNRAEKIMSSKIIFAGGSNLAFGINSKKVENEFSVPVVNLGLNAALGLDFMLNELEDEIKNDDVVFLSLEYFLSTDGNYKFKKNASNHCSIASKYFERNFKNEILLDLDETRLNLTINQEELNAAISSNKEIQEVYARNAFNEYGDVIAHLNKENHATLNDGKNMKYKYWTGIDRLNDFLNLAKAKKATVFFMYPNIANSEYEKNKEVIQQLSVDISQNLKIEVLNKPTDFVFANNLFYDTVYHLNKVGRELRTHKLIELIKKNSNALKSIYSIKSKSTV